LPHPTQPIKEPQTIQLLVVNFDTLESGFGWTLNSPGSATADIAGVYTIRYRLQYANTDNAQHTVTVWLQNNAVDIVNSATSFSVPARKSASIPGFTTAYSEATFEVAVGDEIELYWATDQSKHCVTCYRRHFYVS
jgi:plastocyanin